MKKLFCLIMSVFLVLTGCGENKDKNNKLIFGTEALYPPFEYREYDELKGFDIDLAHLIAKELGKEAVFEDMQFSAILPSLQSGNIDAGIATFTITEERKQNVDLSVPYFFDTLAVVYSKEHPLKTEGDLAGKKIACQLGSAMEFWVKKHIQNPQIVLMNNNAQEIEALKAGHVDAVVMDSLQSIEFTKNNEGLASNTLGKAEDGFGIAVKKGSPLLADINKALEALEKRGELDKLKQKWFGNEKA